MSIPGIIYNGRRYHLKAKGYWISTKPKPQISLHRAVWQDVHGPIPEGCHIHHRDGDRSNNALANLEMLPGRLHISRHHKGRQGLLGEKSGTAKLTAAQVLEIRARYRKGVAGSAQALADQYGVSRSHIGDIVAGRRWAHLPFDPQPGPPAQCRRGHLYTPENTRYARTGYRYCWTCHQTVQKITNKRRAAEAKQARAEARARRRAQKALDL